MIKSFGEVKDYKFENLSDVAEGEQGVSTFEFKPLLNGEHSLKKESHQKTIKAERVSAQKTNFKINEIVEEFRGLKDQESREYEAKIQEEVERRIQEIREKGFQVGYEEGLNQGKEEVFEQMRNAVEQKLEDFNLMINQVMSTQEDILFKQKTEMYQLIKNLSKWIVLRELKEDGKYVERLLEKLLHEMQTRNNLLIQVNASDYEGMEDVLAHVQKRLGELKNVRVEIDSSVQTSGIIIESENGIVNATMEEQFKSLDKLFDDVLAKES